MNLTYEIKENGYEILKDGVLWITQYEPYIPQPNKSYEENALSQIEELKLGFENAENEKTEVEKLHETIAMQENAILEMAEIQSYEYENRVMLEEAVVELAEMIGGAV